MALYEEKRKSFTVNYTSMPQHLLEAAETALGYPLINYVFPRRKLDAILKVENMLHPVVVSNPEDEIKALFKRVDRSGIAANLTKLGVVSGVELLRLPLVFEGRLQGVLWVWGANDMAVRNL